MADMRINSMGPASVAQRNFASANAAAASSMMKLSTGYRINRGADDPAGLISSESLRAAMAELDAESRGMERADAVANVADGALSEVSSLLSDANAAAVASANTAGMSQSERDAYQMEIDSAMQSIDRIASTTKFNGQRVLDGSMSLSAGEAMLNISSSAAADLGQTTINGESFRLTDVASGGRLMPSQGGAEGAQAVIGAAMSQVATMRGQIGAFQKDAIQPQMRSNMVSLENTAAANSAIRDTDYASEAANLSRSRLLGGSSLKALMFANSSSANVLAVLA